MKQTGRKRNLNYIGTYKTWIKKTSGVTEMLFHRRMVRIPYIKQVSNDGLRKMDTYTKYHNGILQGK